MTSVRVGFFRAVLPPLLRSSWAYAKWFEWPTDVLLRKAKLRLHWRIGKASQELRYDVFDDEEYLHDIIPTVIPDHPWFTLDELIHGMGEDELDSKAQCAPDAIRTACIGSPKRPEQSDKQLELKGMEYLCIDPLDD